MNIRRYVASDKDAVCDLHVLALKSVGAFLPGPWNSDLENIENIYFSNGGEFLVGVIQDQIIAMGALRKVDETVAEVKRMRVHPEYQRKGYGQAIYNEIERIAVGLGYRKLCLDTSEKQLAARKFYVKNGFRETSRITPPALEMEMLLFEKEIGREAATPGSDS